MDEENDTSAPIQSATPPPIDEQVTESPAQVEEVEPTNTSQTNETQAEAQEVQFITKVEEKETFENTDTASNSVTTVQEVLGDMMGDAPACPDCGHITIRNGSCYKCLNCGNSLGCS